ncbi:MAG: hypothetical protein ACRD2A_12610, partial [Vicinamibacterales bacterium]
MAGIRWVACALTIATAVGCAPDGAETPPASQSGSTPRASSAAWPVTIEPFAVPAAAASAQPQLTSSSRGVILSWLEQKGQTATLKFAERTGSSGWSAAQTVASGNDWFVSWADVPSVVRMSDGTLVAQWLKAVDPRIEAYDLRLSYSRDNGRSWARPFAPHHDGTK